MSRMSLAGRTAPETVTLEAYAERAGTALACVFSNSAEFDAALIAARRAAGVYGPKRQRWQMLMTVLGVVAGLAVLAVSILLIG